MIVLILTGILAIFAWTAFRLYSTAFKLPKGPLPLPFIGNLGKDLHPPFIFRDLERLRKEYGPVFTYHTPFPVVNIADFDIMKKVMLSSDFSNRLQTPVTEMVNYTKNGGIIMSNGDNWREQRRAALTIMRDFGMGRNLMEEKVLISARGYLKWMKEKANLNEVDFRWPIQLFVANIIQELVFGDRYAYDDCTNLIDYVEGVGRWLMLSGRSKLFLMYMRFPFIRYIPYIGYHAYYKHKENFEGLKNYIRREVAKAKLTYDEHNDPQCFVHAYLRKIPSNPAFLNEDQMMNCCHDLFLAGQESTTTTLRWAMLYLAVYQDVQDKLREEVFRVVGREGEPKMAHKLSMPYTTAFILELQRRANIIPTHPSIFRTTAVDTIIDGHMIPAGTVVNNDLHQIHFTDPHFVDPLRFWPERYLEEDGKTFKKDLVERTVPFGIGKRMCAGEGLARVEMFVGIVVTAQNYRILPLADTPVDLTPIFVNVHHPKPQKLRLVPV